MQDIEPVRRAWVGEVPRLASGVRVDRRAPWFLGGSVSSSTNTVLSTSLSCSRHTHRRGTRGVDERLRAGAHCTELAPGTIRAREHLGRSGAAPQVDVVRALRQEELGGHRVDRDGDAVANRKSSAHGESCSMMGSSNAARPPAVLWAAGETHSSSARGKAIAEDIALCDEHV